MKKFFAICIAFGLTGCAGVVVKEKHTLTYQSAGKVHSHRRVLAVRHMYETCNGDYNIVYEGPTGETQTHSVLDTDLIDVNYKTEEWKIDFTCSK